MGSPFQVTIFAHSLEESQQMKPSNGSDKELAQQPPSRPKNTTKTYQLLFTVQPHSQWEFLKPHGSMDLKGTKYSLNDFIYAKKDTNVSRLQVTPNSLHEFELRKIGFRVAKILEIRASDESHVFLRVCWMYQPDEQLTNTQQRGLALHGPMPSINSALNERLSMKEFINSS
ncbi:hypothetical protein BKA56DRAFT_599551 [Ilyonectria sp. MPI-CAGE-AT-0026]|nr:hypothetical protein BKA56DRAFT_599551 [Ilyonectria sp. MPI-CAGE-AT-0026]